MHQPKLGEVVVLVSALISRSYSTPEYSVPASDRSDGTQNILVFVESPVAHLGFNQAWGRPMRQQMDSTTIFRTCILVAGMPVVVLGNRQITALLVRGGVA
jgi:hypothetical protein